MQDRLRETLNGINREFYSRFARDFSAMRSEDAYEMGRIITRIKPDSRVLDIGCGNGRLGIRLVREDEHLMYMGIDSCEELLEIARETASLELDSNQASRVVFRTVDIVDSQWDEAVRKESSPECFDVVLLIAVLHHVPGKAERMRILGQARDLLSPTGKILLSAWQFPESERMREKIVPWSTVGIDDKELEPDDTLLRWKRGGIGYRYCHWINEIELHALVQASGLSLLETFRSGGYEGNLSLYGVLSRT
jgi:tRNA (uracil-5-)-methyltransferase TRM9